MTKWKTEWFNGVELQTGLNKFSDAGWEVFYIATDHIGISQTRFLVVLRKVEKLVVETPPVVIETPAVTKTEVVATTTVPQGETGDKLPGETKAVEVEK